MKRVIAWVVLAGVVYGVYTVAHAFKNPWARGAQVAPIAALLPPAHAGCASSKDCFHD